MLLRGGPRFGALAAAFFVVGLALTSVTLPDRDGERTAEAVVVADRLDVAPTVLLRYAQAVFTGGEVQDAVASQLGDEVRVSLEVDAGTQQLRVQAHDPDLHTAVVAANTAAETFVAMLNRGGVGVGSFALSRTAQPVAGDDQTVSLPLAVLAAMSLGVSLGLMLAAGLRRGRQAVDA
jgi:hypothetical protein